MRVALQMPFSAVPQSAVIPGAGEGPTRRAMTRSSGGPPLYSGLTSKCSLMSCLMPLGRRVRTVRLLPFSINIVSTDGVLERPNERLGSFIRGGRLARQCIAGYGRCRIEPWKCRKWVDRFNARCHRGCDLARLRSNGSHEHIGG